MALEREGPRGERLNRRQWWFGQRGELLTCDGRATGWQVLEIGREVDSKVTELGLGKGGVGVAVVVGGQRDQQRGRGVAGRASAVAREER